jgi:hypothetical protein
MAIELINVGNIANDGTGDDLREAFIKINQNFEELDLREGELTTASNVGSGQGVFKQRLGYDLQFKSLVAGQNVTLATTDNQITFNALGGLQQLLVVSDSGSVVLSDGGTLRIFGGNGISTSYVGSSTIQIDNTALTDLVQDTTPTLGGTLDGNNNDITNISNITANVLFGNFRGPVDGTVYGIDIRDLAVYFEDNFDFGSFTSTVTNFIDWVIFGADVDFGSFANPDSRTVDLGSF